MKRESRSINFVFNPRKMLPITRACPPSFFLPKYSSLANQLPRFVPRTLLFLRPSTTAATTTNTDTLPPSPSFSALGVNPPSTSTTTGTSSPSSSSLQWPTTPFLQRAGPLPRAFGRKTKSHIPGLFAARAPQLDPTPFVAAAHVFPMRVNSFVVEELVDWFVCLFLYLILAHMLPKTHFLFVFGFTLTCT